MAERTDHGSDPPPLTYEQTTQVLKKLADLGHPLVLIGGQAVNFWAEYYLPRVPALVEGAPYTSGDIDFAAPTEAVRACALRLGGRARLASLCDPDVPQGLEHVATPNTGVVSFVDDVGVERVIDFLEAPAGLNWKETFEKSRRAEILDESGEVIATFQVIHPVLNLQSRAYNVARLPGYQTAHARNQLRASIVCAREFVRDVVEAQDLKLALDLNEKIFAIAAHGAGIEVFEQHQIDVFEAILAAQELPALFHERRYPQMRAFVDSQRERAAAATMRSLELAKRNKP